MKFLSYIVASVLAFVLGVWLNLPRGGAAQAQASIRNSAPSHRPEVSAVGQWQVGPGRVEEALSASLPALKESEPLKQRYELFEALRDVSAAELKELMGRAEKLPCNYRQRLQLALMERWIEIDQSGARDWIKSHPVGADILAAWARHDAESALVDAFSGRTPRWTAEAVTIAIEQVAGSDVRNQVLKLMQLPQGKLRDEALVGGGPMPISRDSGLIGAWAKEDPAAAWNFATSLPSGKLRTQALEQAAVVWAKSDPSAAMAQAQAILPELTPGIIGSSIINRITNVVAEKDPKAALEFAASLPEEFQTNPAIAAARSLAGSEPIAALEWCRTNGIELTRGERIGGNAWSASVLDQCIAAHLAETVQWIENLPEAVEREQLAECALRRALRDNSSANVKKPLADREAPVMRLYNQLPPDAQELAAGTVAAALAAQPGLADLTTITARFSTERTQLAAITGAISTVYEHDASAGESMLASLPSGPQQDAALSGIVKALAYRAPADAAARAAEITDLTAQREALDRVIPFWLQKDQGAARTWLAETATLPREWVREWESET